MFNILVSVATHRDIPLTPAAAAKLKPSDVSISTVGLSFAAPFSPFPAETFSPDISIPKPGKVYVSFNVPVHPMGLSVDELSITPHVCGIPLPSCLAKARRVAKITGTRASSTLLIDVKV